MPAVPDTFLRRKNMFSDFFDWTWDDDMELESENLNESEDWNSEEDEKSEDELDETGENGEDDGNSRISFGGTGHCTLCDCRAYLVPYSGEICRNCGHHKRHHF